jgi:hypothetical protein
VTVKHHVCALARTTLSLGLRCCVRAYPVYDNSQYKRMCLNLLLSNLKSAIQEDNWNHQNRMSGDNKAITMIGALY